MAPCRWKGADKKDLGDNFFVFSYLYNESPEKKLYIKNSDEKLTFDLKTVQEWTKNKNKEIAEIIRERREGLRD